MSNKVQFTRLEASPLLVLSPTNRNARELNYTPPLLVSSPTNRDAEAVNLSKNRTNANPLLVGDNTNKGEGKMSRRI